MNSRLIQGIGAAIMVVTMAIGGTLVRPIQNRVEEAGLRYTDVSVEGAPPFVALGTAIGALRGLIVDYLWIKVNYMKEKGLFYEVMADAELITQLQPRFAAVWAFHGHNMAYNISVATHTQEERWEWVNAGIRLVREEGLRHNPNDLQLHRELAFWFAHKIESYSDDAHLFYKREFCREWHFLLGPPPVSWDERTAWIESIADAPASLDLAERETPGVRALVDRLNSTLTPFGEQLGYDASRAFLETYGGWDAVKRQSEVAKLAGLEERTRRENKYFEAFDEIASDPSLADAWDTLIRHTRKRVLIDEYNMDPQLMAEMTREYGPIDWRHGQAHALYWSHRGQVYGEARVASDDDIYKIINNDRLFLQAMQGLARYGRIEFDPFSPELPSRFPEPIWIDTIASQFPVFYAKHYNTRGAGGETFIAFLKNFMASAIRQTYRAGEVARAEHLLKLLNDRFNAPGVNPALRDPQLAMPIDAYVVETIKGEITMQPHIAPSEASASMRYAYRLGVGRNDQEKYDKAIQYVNQIIDLFREGEHEYANKWGIERMADLMQQLDTVRLTTFVQLMLDPSVHWSEKATIWNQIDRFDRFRDVRLRTYDMLAARLREAYQRSPYAVERTFDELFPAPPGIEEFRLAEAARRAKEMEQQGQGVDTRTDRDAISPSGG